MSGPTRRGILTGVSTGAVLLSAGYGSGETPNDRFSLDGEARTSGPASDDTLAVSIVETDAPVGAGDYLQVTAVVENRSASDVRTDVDLIVGDEPERVGRIRTTIAAGERTEVTHGFYTYPVPEDNEFPVRMEADGAADERTVRVIGAMALDDRRPDHDLAIQPGTEVLFEAAALDTDAPETAAWWVDGEQVGVPFGGPWPATYAAETGYHYWRESFETTGTHEVAAAVVSNETDETYAARWTVDVTDDGLASPSIDAFRPTVGEIRLEEGDTTEFELDLAHQDGELDRVVWWLTQADVILDVTDVSGEADTATLSVDGRLCHTCNVVPWVVCADGTVTAPTETWQIDSLPAEASVEASIEGTNEPVDAGEYLAVTVAVENAGEGTATSDLELVVGHDPTVVEERSVTLDPGQTERLTLGYETYPTNHDERFPVRLNVDGATADEVSVRVEA